MNEEHLEKIKLVIKNNSDYKEHYNLHDYFEVEYIDELVKENERLNRTNNEIFKANETLAEEIKKLQTQLQQKESIIKEVRETLEEANEWVLGVGLKAILLEILDKGE